MAIVADGPAGRVYLPPVQEHEEVARSASPRWTPHVAISHWPGRTNVVEYGLDHFDDLFTPRQLVTLSLLSELVAEVREQIRLRTVDATDKTTTRNYATTADAPDYADAVSAYLALSASKSANLGSTITSWMNDRGAFRETFARQAIPMVWDYAEANTFSDSGGTFLTAIDKCQKAIAIFPSNNRSAASQRDAATHQSLRGAAISTDPPYYDNIGYADLSDFFYVWLRHSLKSVFPDLFSTIAVPKAEELIASPYRHGSREMAEKFFLEGMTKAMHNIAMWSHPTLPITIYYAFKQSDTEADATASTGWETFLEAVLRAGLSLVGTWPMRTEGAGRILARGANALASSIVLVCRPRASDAGTISRRQFVRLLNEALPYALAKMTGADEGEHSPVAPVDLSQAIIGPGMAIFSRYDAVLEADGTPMTVKTALQLINRFLAEDDFDGDTQFCLHWFEHHGWDAGKFGEADTLARAKGTSVDGVKAAGVIEAGGGNVRLLKWKEYPADWNPSLDTRIPVWEALHQLIRAYSSKGDAGAGKVLKACSGKAEAARQLAYRLYTLCERKGWAEDARAYNEIVTGWPGIEKAAGTGGEEQRELFNG
jgi:putative DNA methylase